MNIVIFGGAGFLGCNLVRYCLGRPTVKLTVVDSLEPSLRATTRHLSGVWKQIEFVRGSILDDTLVASIVQDKDIIFNCAGQTSHPLSIQDPLLDARINCTGNLILLEGIRLVNPKAIVVYASSSTVIGKAVHNIVDESHPERPLDIYSANKGVAEKYHRIYHVVHGLRTVSLRFANLFGAYGKGYPEFGFVNYFIELAHRGEDIRIFGEGAQTRNVLYAEDAAEAMWLAAHAPKLLGESWFVGHDEHLCVSSIAASIVKAFGKGRLVHIPWPEERRRIEVDSVRISSQPFRDLTGWMPRHSFEAGLRKTLALRSEAQLV